VGDWFTVLRKKQCRIRNSGIQMVEVGTLLFEDLIQHTMQNLLVL